MLSLSFSLSLFVALFLHALALCIAAAGGVCVFVCVCVCVRVWRASRKINEKYLEKLPKKCLYYLFVPPLCTVILKHHMFFLSIHF